MYEDLLSAPVDAKLQVSWLQVPQQRRTIAEWHFWNLSFWRQHTGNVLCGNKGQVSKRNFDLWLCFTLPVSALVLFFTSFLVKLKSKAIWHFILVCFCSVKHCSPRQSRSPLGRTRNKGWEIPFCSRTRDMVWNVIHLLATNDEKFLSLQTCVFFLFLFQPHLLHKLSLNNAGASNLIQNDEFDDNFAELEVYYEELNFESMTENPSYEVSKYSVHQESRTFRSILFTDVDFCFCLFFFGNFLLTKKATTPTQLLAQIKRGKKRDRQTERENGVRLETKTKALVCVPSRRPLCSVDYQSPVLIAVQPVRVRSGRSHRTMGWRVRADVFRVRRIHSGCARSLVRQIQGQQTKLCENQRLCWEHYTEQEQLSFRIKQIVANVLTGRKPEAFRFRLCVFNFPPLQSGSVVQRLTTAPE